MSNASLFLEPPAHHLDSCLPTWRLSKHLYEQLFAAPIPQQEVTVRFTSKTIIYLRARFTFEIRGQRGRRLLCYSPPESKPLSRPPPLRWMLAVLPDNPSLLDSTSCRTLVRAKGGITGALFHHPTAMTSRRWMSVGVACWWMRQRRLLNVLLMGVCVARGVMSSPGCKLL
ncbi:hypothetical protein VTI74DRAFT_4837 [Chaetomium olivicolor]